MIVVNGGMFGPVIVAPRSYSCARPSRTVVAEPPVWVVQLVSVRLAAACWRTMNVRPLPDPVAVFEIVYWPRLVLTAVITVFSGMFGPLIGSP